MLLSLSLTFIIIFYFHFINFSFFFLTFFHRLPPSSVASANIDDQQLYLLRLNLFRRASKSFESPPSDLDVQFSLDQLFEQLSIVSSGSLFQCTSCSNYLPLDAQLSYRPLIWHQNAPLYSASVIVNLCSRVSHNLTFTFASLRKTQLPSSRRMVEESAATMAASVPSAPNRLILLRPHSVGCRYYTHHQKRPSSVNSSSSGSDHTKDSEPDGLLGSDHHSSSGSPDVPAILRFGQDVPDCEYGPGFVGRLCNKFMTMYGKEPVNGTTTPPVNAPTLQPSLIKRCSSMEELTYRSRNGAAANGLKGQSAQGVIAINGKGHTSAVPNNGQQQQLTNGYCNHHQQVNGTKKRLLWSSLNGNGPVAVPTNGHTPKDVSNGRSFVKNGHSHNQQPVNGVMKAKEATPVSGSTPEVEPKVANSAATSLYPNNIVKNFVKSHQQAPKANVPATNTNLTAITGTTTTTNGHSTVASKGSNGAVRHYPSPITHNYVRSNLLLTAPMPYIRKAKSVEALSAPFSVSANGHLEKAHSPPVHVSSVEAELVNICPVDDKPISCNAPIEDASKWTTLTVAAAQQQQQSPQLKASSLGISTGNVVQLSNDEAVCCYQSTYNAGEQETETMSELRGAVSVMISTANRSSANERDCTADQSIVTVPTTATASGAPDTAFEGTLTTPLNAPLTVEQLEDEAKSDDGTLDLHDSGIGEASISISLASSTNSSSTMIGDNVSGMAQSATSNSPSHLRRLISDSEMPKPDIVKTYKRLFETPIEPASTNPVPTTSISACPLPVKSSPANTSDTALSLNEESSALSTLSTALAKTACDDSTVKSRPSTPSLPPPTTPPPALPCRLKARASPASTPTTTTSPLPVKPVIPPRRVVQSPVVAAASSKASLSRGKSLTKTRGHAQDRRAVVLCVLLN